jgi:hypothetical protein
VHKKLQNSKAYYSDLLMYEKMNKLFKNQKIWFEISKQVWIVCFWILKFFVHLYILKICNSEVISCTVSEFLKLVQFVNILIWNIYCNHKIFYLFIFILLFTLLYLIFFCLFTNWTLLLYENENINIIQ